MKKMHGQTTLKRTEGSSPLSQNTLIPVIPNPFEQADILTRATLKLTSSH